MRSFVGNAAGVVCLDDYNSDLNFVIEADGVTGSSLHKNGFEYIWAGARATHGVSRGKVCYEVLVQEKLDVHMPDTETYPHVMRVGWSVDASPFTVGEASLSYGYGGTGKSSCNNKFFNYGEPYSTDDVITCYIDLDAVPKTIFFAKNGKYLGVAFRLGPEVDGKVFHPHVSVKNMKFVANFGGFNPYFPPVPGFYPMQHLPPHMLILPPASPKDRRECEVVMMVGLPSCGKTTWLDKYVKEHPGKKYNILGTNDILVKMKVMGLGRKRNYHGRWDALIKQASGILNEMLKLAKHKNRNYILDQTNVYPNARRRKMDNFPGYHRIAVVVVNENSVLMARNDKVVREDGKVVPESAFMEMKANFTLPVQGDIFDEVWYVEENEERSQLLVREFNEEGRNWKEKQKKRPVDEVEVKKEPQMPDFKKPKYVGSANSYQSRNQYGAQNHGPGSHPQYLGRATVPCQDIQPADGRRQESYHQQSNPTGYPQRQPQYIPQHHERNKQNPQHHERNQQNPQHHERNQQNRGTNYDRSGSNYNDRQGTGSLGHGGFHQRQPGNYNPGYHQTDQGERGFQRGDPGNMNYNQPTNFLAGRGEELPSRNNPEYHQVGQREMGFPRGNLGANYILTVQLQGSWGDEGSHGKNYSRRDDNSSTRPAYSGSSQRYEVKRENWNSPQEAYRNPNEGNYGRNQQRGYDSSQNYAVSKSYNDPSQSYQGNSQNWNPPPQGGFSNHSQGFWSGEQGWSSTHGPNLSQGYGNSQQNVPQATRQGNWNNNQPYYQQGQHQNYQY